MNKVSVLYITYDGITDHIGQSQIAPYLIGLSKKGHRISLLSAEKIDRNTIINQYKNIFEEHQIDWHYVPFRKSPPIISKIWNIVQMQRIAGRLIRKDNIKVLHCRSYIASLIGLHFKKKWGIKFIFDMRDFWADAGKETKRFDIENNKVHNLIYNFFKNKEKQFLENADYIVSLTKAGKIIIESWAKTAMKISAPIGVIPCGADFDFYDLNNIDKQKLEGLRSELELQTKFVLGYVGSLGSSYLIDEMMDFFKVLLEKKSNAIFLIVANNDHYLAIDALNRKGIDKQKVIIVKANKEEIPNYIALFNLSVFFYYTVFSRKACSPTRLAELYAMNVPVISNSGVGDLDELMNPVINNSTVVKDFTNEEYSKALNKILPSINNSNHIRDNSTYFTLIRGVELYNEVYETLA